MHPILASARRAALYCGAWGAIAALLVYAMWDAAGIRVAGCRPRPEARMSDRGLSLPHAVVSLPGPPMRQVDRAPSLPPLPQPSWRALFLW